MLQKTKFLFFLELYQMQEKPSLLLLRAQGAKLTIWARLLLADKVGLQSQEKADLSY